MSEDFISAIAKARENSGSITINAVNENVEWICNILAGIEHLRFTEIKVLLKPSVFAADAGMLLPYCLTVVCDVNDLSDSNAVLGIINLTRNSQRVVLKWSINEKNVDKLFLVGEFCRKLSIKSLLLSVDMALDDCFLRLKEFVKEVFSAGITVNFNNYQRELSILLNDYIDMQQGPIVVQFEVTNKCNHQCIFCYHHSNLLLGSNDAYFKKHKKDNALIKRSRKWHEQKIDFDFFRRYVKELKNSGCRYIQLGGGGEPFTHPDLMNMFRLLKKHGFTVQVFTNFSIPDKAMIREIVDLGVDVIEINLSAGNALTYSKIHNVAPDVFNNVADNLMFLKKIKKDKPSIRIMNPICSLNYSEIPEMVSFAHSLGADAVYLGHLQTTVLTKHLLLTKNQISVVNRLVCDAREQCRKLGIKENFDFYLQVLNNKGTVKGSHTKEIYDKCGCLMSFFESQIHLDGKIAPCCLHPTIFDINGRSFKEVWNSREYKSYRKKALGLYKYADKPLLCRGCRMCVYQEDIQRFYNDLGGCASFLL